MSAVPSPPSTVSAAAKPLIVSLPVLAVIVSARELPVIVKPSLCELSVKVTADVEVEAEIASTLTSCPWVAVLSVGEVAVRTSVSVPSPPSTVSAPAKP